MAEILKYSRSNSQDFGHDHSLNQNLRGQNGMVNLKFDYEIELKMSILTIDHGANSRVSWSQITIIKQYLKMRHFSHDINICW